MLQTDTSLFPQVYLEAILLLFEQQQESREKMGIVLHVALQDWRMKNTSETTLSLDFNTVSPFCVLITLEKDLSCVRGLERVTVLLNANICMGKKEEQKQKKKKRTNFMKKGKYSL